MSYPQPINIESSSLVRAQAMFIDPNRIQSCTITLDPSIVAFTLDIYHPIVIQPLNGKIAIYVQSHTNTHYIYRDRILDSKTSTTLYHSDSTTTLHQSFDKGNDQIYTKPPATRYFLINISPKSPHPPAISFQWDTTSVFYCPPVPLPDLYLNNTITTNNTNNSTNNTNNNNNNNNTSNTFASSFKISINNHDNAGSNNDNNNNNNINYNNHDNNKNDNHTTSINDGFIHTSTNSNTHPLQNSLTTSTSANHNYNIDLINSLRTYRNQLPFEIYLIDVNSIDNNDNQIELAIPPTSTTTTTTATTTTTTTTTATAGVSKCIPHNQINLFTSPSRPSTSHSTALSNGPNDKTDLLTLTMEPSDPPMVTTMSRTGSANDVNKIDPTINHDCTFQSFDQVNNNNNNITNIEQQYQSKPKRNIGPRRRNDNKIEQTNIITSPVAQNEELILPPPSIIDLTFGNTLNSISSDHQTSTPTKQSHYSPILDKVSSSSLLPLSIKSFNSPKDDKPSPKLIYNEEEIPNLELFPQDTLYTSVSNLPRALAMAHLVNQVRFTQLRAQLDEQSEIYKTKKANRGKSQHDIHPNIDHNGNESDQLNSDITDTAHATANANPNTQFIDDSKSLSSSLHTNPRDSYILNQNIKSLAPNHTIIWCPDFSIINTTTTTSSVPITAQSHFLPGTNYDNTNINTQTEAINSSDYDDLYNLPTSIKEKLIYQALIRFISKDYNLNPNIRTTKPQSSDSDEVNNAQDYDENDTSNHTNGVNHDSHNNSVVDNPLDNNNNNNNNNTSDNNNNNKNNNNSNTNTTTTTTTNTTTTSSSSSTTTTTTTTNNNTTTTRRSNKRPQWSPSLITKDVPIEQQLELSSNLAQKILSTALNKGMSDFDFVLMSEMIFKQPNLYQSVQDNVDDSLTTPSAQITSKIFDTVSQSIDSPNDHDLNHFSAMNQSALPFIFPIPSKSNDLHQRQPSISSTTDKKPAVPQQTQINQPNSGADIVQDAKVDSIINLTSEADGNIDGDGDDDVAGNALTTDSQVKKKTRRGKRGGGAKKFQQQENETAQEDIVMDINPLSNDTIQDASICPNKVHTADNHLPTQHVQVQGDVPPNNKNPPNITTAAVLTTSTKTDPNVTAKRLAQKLTNTVNNNQDDPDNVVFTLRSTLFPTRAFQLHHPHTHLYHNNSTLLIPPHPLSQQHQYHQQQQQQQQQQQPDNLVFKPNSNVFDVHNHMYSNDLIPLSSSNHFITTNSYPDSITLPISPSQPNFQLMLFNLYRSQLGSYIDNILPKINYGNESHTTDAQQLIKMDNVYDKGTDNHVDSYLHNIQCPMCYHTQTNNQTKIDQKYKKYNVNTSKYCPTHVLLSLQFWLLTGYDSILHSISQRHPINNGVQSFTEMALFHAPQLDLHSHFTRQYLDDIDNQLNIANSHNPFQLHNFVINDKFASSTMIGPQNLNKNPTMTTKTTTTTTTTTTSNNNNRHITPYNTISNLSRSLVISPILLKYIHSCRLPPQPITKTIISSFDKSAILPMISKFAHINGDQRANSIPRQHDMTPGSEVLFLMDSDVEKLPLQRSLCHILRLRDSSGNNNSDSNHNNSKYNHTTTIKSSFHTLAQQLTLLFSHFFQQPYHQPRIFTILLPSRPNKDFMEWYTTILSQLPAFTYIHLILVDFSSNSNNITGSNPIPFRLVTNHTTPIVPSSSSSSSSTSTRKVSHKTQQILTIKQLYQTARATVFGSHESGLCKQTSETPTWLPDWMYLPHNSVRTYQCSLIPGISMHITPPSLVSTPYSLSLRLQQLHKHTPYTSQLITSTDMINPMMIVSSTNTITTTTTTTTTTNTTTITSHTNNPSDLSHTTPLPNHTTTAHVIEQSLMPSYQMSSNYLSLQHGGSKLIFQNPLGCDYNEFSCSILFTTHLISLIDHQVITLAQPVYEYSDRPGLYGGIGSINPGQANINNNDNNNNNNDNYEPTFFTSHDGNIDDLNNDNTDTNLDSILIPPSPTLQPSSSSISSPSVLSLSTDLPHQHGNPLLPNPSIISMNSLRSSDSSDVNNQHSLFPDPSNNIQRSYRLVSSQSIHISPPDMTKVVPNAAPPPPDKTTPWTSTSHLDENEKLPICIPFTLTNTPYHGLLFPIRSSEDNIIFFVMTNSNTTKALKDIFVFYPQLRKTPQTFFVNSHQSHSDGYNDDVNVQQTNDDGDHSGPNNGGGNNVSNNDDISPNPHKESKNPPQTSTSKRKTSKFKFKIPSYSPNDKTQPRISYLVHCRIVTIFIQFWLKLHMSDPHLNLRHHITKSQPIRSISTPWTHDGVYSSDGTIHDSSVKSTHDMTNTPARINNQQQHQQHQKPTKGQHKQLNQTKSTNQLNSNNLIDEQLLFPGPIQAQEHSSGDFFLYYIYPEVLFYLQNDFCNHVFITMIVNHCRMLYAHYAFITNPNLMVSPVPVANVPTPRQIIHNNLLTNITQTWRNATFSPSYSIEYLPIIFEQLLSIISASLLAESINYARMSTFDFAVSLQQIKQSHIVPIQPSSRFSTPSPHSSTNNNTSSPFIYNNVNPLESTLELETWVITHALVRIASYLMTTTLNDSIELLSDHIVTLPNDSLFQRLNNSSDQTNQLASTGYALTTQPALATTHKGLSLSISDTNVVSLIPKDPILDQRRLIVLSNISHLHLQKLRAIIEKQTAIGHKTNPLVSHTNSSEDELEAKLFQKYDYYGSTVVTDTIPINISMPLDPHIEYTRHTWESTRPHKRYARHDAKLPWFDRLRRLTRCELHIGVLLHDWSEYVAYWATEVSKVVTFCLGQKSRNNFRELVVFFLGKHFLGDKDDYETNGIEHDDGNNNNNNSNNNNNNNNDDNNNDHITLKDSSSSTQQKQNTPPTTTSLVHHSKYGASNAKQTLSGLESPKKAKLSKNHTIVLDPWQEFLTAFSSNYGTGVNDKDNNRPRDANILEYHRSYHDLLEPSSWNNYWTHRLIIEINSIYYNSSYNAIIASNVVETKQPSKPVTSPAFPQTATISKIMPNIQEIVQDTQDVKLIEDNNNNTVNIINKLDLTRPDFDQIKPADPLQKETTLHLESNDRDQVDQSDVLNNKNDESDQDKDESALNDSTGQTTTRKPTRRSRRYPKTHQNQTQTTVPTIQSGIETNTNTSKHSDLLNNNTQCKSQTNTTNVIDDNKSNVTKTTTKHNQSSIVSAISLSTTLVPLSTPHPVFSSLPAPPLPSRKAFKITPTMQKSQNNSPNTVKITSISAYLKDLYLYIRLSSTGTPSPVLATYINPNPTYFQSNVQFTLQKLTPHLYRQFALRYNPQEITAFSGPVLPSKTRRELPPDRTALASPSGTRLNHHHHHHHHHHDNKHQSTHKTSQDTLAVIDDDDDNEYENTPELSVVFHPILPATPLSFLSAMTFVYFLLSFSLFLTTLNVLSILLSYLYVPGTFLLEPPYSTCIAMITLFFFTPRVLLRSEYWIENSLSFFLQCLICVLAAFLLGNYRDITEKVQQRTEQRIKETARQVFDHVKQNQLDIGHFPDNYDYNIDSRYNDIDKKSASTINNQHRTVFFGEEHGDHTIDMTQNMIPKSGAATFKRKSAPHFPSSKSKPVTLQSLFQQYRGSNRILVEEITNPDMDEDHVENEASDDNDEAHNNNNAADSEQTSAVDNDDTTVDDDAVIYI